MSSSSVRAPTATGGHWRSSCRWSSGSRGSRSRAGRVPAPCRSVPGCRSPALGRRRRTCRRQPADWPDRPWSPSSTGTARPSPASEVAGCQRPAPFPADGTRCASAPPRPRVPPRHSRPPRWPVHQARSRRWSRSVPDRRRARSATSCRSSSGSTPALEGSPSARSMPAGHLEPGHRAGAGTLPPHLVPRGPVLGDPVIRPRPVRHGQGPGPRRDSSGLVRLPGRWTGPVPSSAPIALTIRGRPTSTAERAAGPRGRPSRLVRRRPEAGARPAGVPPELGGRAPRSTVERPAVESGRRAGAGDGAVQGSGRVRWLAGIAEAAMEVETAAGIRPVARVDAVAGVRAGIGSRLLSGPALPGLLPVAPAVAQAGLGVAGTRGLPAPMRRLAAGGRRDGAVVAARAPDRS